MAQLVPVLAAKKRVEGETAAGGLGAREAARADGEGRHLPDRPSPPPRRGPLRPHRALDELPHGYRINNESLECITIWTELGTARESSGNALIDGSLKWRCEGSVPARLSTSHAKALRPVPGYAP
ncbi:hypothetical protein GCM10023334_086200 [Nonomuraea thailandensis]